MGPEPLSGSLLAEIIGISADAIICVDRDQSITFFNEGAVRIFGYAAEEVRGRPLSILIPERARGIHDRHVADFGRAAANARRMGERQEISGRRKSGEEFPAEAAIAKLRHGDAVVFSVVLRDVTERRRAELELRRAVAARDDVLSVVAHDLRNPVQAVKMLSSALLQRESAALTADMADQVRVIREAAQQMDGLIQDLLDMTRAEAGRFSVDMSPTSLTPVLERALVTLVPLGREKKIDVITSLDTHLPEVHADPDRIVQVMSNLVGNAIKYTPTGGVVTVLAQSSNGDVLVSVVDSGPGVPTEHLEHVFDRYWQSSRRNRGAGLGLPIAKAIIEAHGGRIWAENAVGSGAIFRFTLPRSPG